MQDKDLLSSAFHRCHNQLYWGDNQNRKYDHRLLNIWIMLDRSVHNRCTCGNPSKASEFDCNTLFCSNYIGIKKKVRRCIERGIVWGRIRHCFPSYHMIFTTYLWIILKLERRPKFNPFISPREEVCKFLSQYVWQTTCLHWTQVVYTFLCSSVVFRQSAYSDKVQQQQQNAKKREQHTHTHTHTSE
jgi:hypothetical protein